MARALQPCNCLAVRGNVAGFVHSVHRGNPTIQARGQRRGAHGAGASKAFAKMSRAQHHWHFINEQARRHWMSVAWERRWLSRRNERIKSGYTLASTINCLLLMAGWTMIDGPPNRIPNDTISSIELAEQPGGGIRMDYSTNPPVTQESCKIMVYMCGPKPPTQQVDIQKGKLTIIEDVDLPLILPAHGFPGRYHIWARLLFAIGAYSPWAYVYIDATW